MLIDLPFVIVGVAQWLNGDEIDLPVEAVGLIQVAKPVRTWIAPSI